MPDDAVRLTTAHTRYIREHTRDEGDFMRELKDAATAAEIPSIWISPEQANLMQIILKLAKAKQVVEVGTLAGYSAISMARALPADGTASVTTIEKSSKHADFAREWIGKSDVADRVRVLEGDAVELLKKLSDNSADAMFLDADKNNYGTYLQEGRRIVRTGGMILADNALGFGQLLDESITEGSVVHIREFNELIAKEPGLHACIMPIGDGCWVAVVEE